MNHDRYLEMACFCGAVWVEDRLEVSFSCPLCDRKVAWSSLAETEGCTVIGPGTIDFSPVRLATLLKSAGFTESTDVSSRSRHTHTLWCYLEDRPEGQWAIQIEATAFRGDDKLRSVLVLYRVDGVPAARLMVLNIADLLTVLAAIAGGIEDAVGEVTTLAKAVFCGAGLEEGTPD